jgi:hypothetical protein
MTNNDLASKKVKAQQRKADQTSLKITVKFVKSINNIVMISAISK